MAAKSTRFFIFLLLLALIGLTVRQLYITRPVKAPELKALPLARVELIQAVRKTTHPFDHITGHLQPARKSTLHFEVNGNLLKRLVEAGALVQRGELLLQLDDADYKDRAIEAKAQLQQEQARQARDQQLLEFAHSNAQLAQREVNRLISLGKKALSSKSKLDERRQQLLQLQGEDTQLAYTVNTAPQRLSALQSALKRAQRNVQRTHLTAPYSGRVNRVLIEEGDHITPNDTVLELIDDLSLDLYTEVSGTTAAALKQGQQLDVSVKGRSYPGQLIAVQRDPDPETFTHPIKIRIPGEGLIPGMLASARLPLTTLPNTIVVPRSALLQDSGHSYLFVVKGDRLERRQVKSGIHSGNLLVIDAGLAEGETLVARDVAALIDGQQIVLPKLQRAADFQ